jgi:hypothetical protein
MQPRKMLSSPFDVWARDRPQTGVTKEMKRGRVRVLILGLVSKSNPKSKIENQK